MPKPPLDPPVADQAPTAGDLTAYDHEHLVTYLRLLMPTLQVPTGQKSLGSSCTSIPPVNPIGRDAPLTATSRAPSG